jgi:N-acetylneuraminic acid mutarotase
MKNYSIILTLFLCATIFGCGGGGTTGSGSNTLPVTYTLGGTISGLAGSGLVLQNNGGNNLAVSANGSSFTFTTAFSSGTGYSVTVLTQPTNPNQTCVVTSGSGTLNANVSNVSLACTTNSYTIGGTVSGLSGTGLVLQDNLGNNLPISAGATSFTFTTAIASGGTYSATVFSQPSSPAQTCGITSGNGTITNANVKSVQVTCTNTVTYTIDGSVINLAGTGGGLQLQDNGIDSLLLNANGSFTFPTALASGSTYNVTVSMQPSAPAQTCEVTHGTGTVIANVTSVVVNCGRGEWTWVDGGNVANQKGTYGTLGTSALSNIPGARDVAVSWIDPAGNFWLFGGAGYDSVGVLSQLNDLWKYSAGQWTWMGGSNVVRQHGTYGTLGAAAPGNIPGARQSSASRTDSAGNFWIFGGGGYDSAGDLGLLNDLWKYSSGQWTWMGGSNVVTQKGTYGTQGTAAPGNVPGGRTNAVSWTDPAGNFWLFSGQGNDSTGPGGPLNDLWKFSAGQWTWMGGSDVARQQGTYGIQGTAAPSNIPGARVDAVGWIDTAGNFWLFGGGGYDSTGTYGILNDLWKYSAGQWTWMGGSNPIPLLPSCQFNNVCGQKGTYGTQGTPALSNNPGAREVAVSWTDAAGDFWLFGGYGYDSTGMFGMLNDLWRYNSGEWTWMGGSNVVNQKGTYGIQGTAAPSNDLGGRGGGVAWTDPTGNFWLFGGFGYDSPGTQGNLNDLWKYAP